jgi:hypothetical protein
MNPNEGQHPGLPPFNHEQQPPPPPHGELLMDFYLPTTFEVPSCIQFPDVAANQFEIKSSTINLLNSFHGLPNEDPYRHLDYFLSVCSTIRVPQFTEDDLKLRMFPFSLKDKARSWFNSLEPNSIHSWAEMQMKFLKKYFPMGKTSDIRRAITGFTQIDQKQFHETWERLKDLLKSCPHHAVPKWQLVQSFYDGVSEQHRQMIDSACGGGYLLKSPDDAWKLFQTLSNNSAQRSSTRKGKSTQPCRGVHEISRVDEVALQVEALTRKMDQIMKNGLPTSNQTVQNQESCSFCYSTSHFVRDCPIAGQSPDYAQEQANAVYSKQVNDPYSNTYNPGYKNHPAFSWRSQESSPSFQGQNSFHSQSQQPQYRPNPQPYNQRSNYQPPPPPRSQGFEERVISNVEANTRLLQTHSQSISKLEANAQSMARLEAQIGQLANALNRREEGKLPSQPVANPKGILVIDDSPSSSCNAPPEQVQSITTLRSGKIINSKVGEEKKESNEQSKNPKESQSNPNESPSHPNLNKVPQNPKGKAIEVVSPSFLNLDTSFEPPVPFPQRLKEPSHFGKQ